MNSVYNGGTFNEPDEGHPLDETPEKRWPQ